jgi:hypothetical protein
MLHVAFCLAVRCLTLRTHVRRRLAKVDGQMSSWAKRHCFEQPSARLDLDCRSQHFHGDDLLARVTRDTHNHERLQGLYPQNVECFCFDRLFPVFVQEVLRKLNWLLLRMPIVFTYQVYD